MKLTLVATLFFCIWIHGCARNGTNNEVDIYEKNSTDAVKFAVDRFLKLLQVRHSNVSKTFDNETSNRITQNISEEAITSFVNHSAANETTSSSLENNVVSFVDNTTQVETIAYGTKKIIDLENYFDGMENVTMNFGAVARQIQPLFLTQHQNPIGKKVKMENDIMYFLDDEEVNVTVKNNQLTLSVKDDHFKQDEKHFYFCFKSTKQTYISEICPFGFCEIKMVFLGDATTQSTVILFDNQTQNFLTNFITAMISQNSMKVTNVPNAPPPITTCNPDFSQGYWTVKVINKGDKGVKLFGVQLYTKELKELGMATGTIIGIAGGCSAVFIVVIIGGILIWWFCFHKKKQQKQKVDACIEEKQIEKTKTKEDVKKDEVVVQNVTPKVKVSKENFVVVSLNSAKDKKKKDEIVKDEKKIKKLSIEKMKKKPETTESKETVKTGSTETKTLSTEKKDDTKTKKVDDANLNTAVEKENDGISEVVPMTEKIKGEAEEDKRILNEDPSTPGHENRIKYIEARQRARLQKEFFTMDFEKAAYSRPTPHDNDYLSLLVKKMENYKKSEPETWVVDVEMNVTEAVVYLAGLGVFSQDFATNLLMDHFYYCINEQNFQTLFTTFNGFMNEIKKARDQYHKCWTRQGFEQKTGFSYKIMKKMENKVVLGRLAAFNVQFCDVLKHFAVNFENPVIFLAPLQFLIVLAIRPQTTDKEIKDIFDVIIYRASVMFKNFDVSQTFTYYFPIPPLAYTHYILNSIDANACIENGKKILEDAKKNMSKSRISKLLWDEVVESAKDAVEKSDEKIETVEYSTTEETKESVEKRTAKKKKYKMAKIDVTQNATSVTQNATNEGADVDITQNTEKSMKKDDATQNATEKSLGN